MMKILKKNQLAILVIALMLVTAGYLNYTASQTTRNFKFKCDRRRTICSNWRCNTCK